MVLKPPALAPHHRVPRRRPSRAKRTRARPPLLRRGLAQGARARSRKATSSPSCARGAPSATCLLGRHDDAYAEAKTGLEHCRELGDRYEEAATYRVLALSAAAVGKPDEAKQRFEQGFAYYDDIETPYEWGKLWMSPTATGCAASTSAEHRGRPRRAARLTRRRAITSSGMGAHGQARGSERADRGADTAARSRLACDCGLPSDPRRPQRASPRCDRARAARAQWARETRSG